MPDHPPARDLARSPSFEPLEDRRLLAADGYAIDPTYGTNGRTTLGTVAEAPDYVNRLIATPGGKLLVLGNTGDAPTVTHLTQFNLDGTIDPSFASGGGRKIITDFGTAGVADAVVQADGRIVVMRSGSGLALKRYLADGSADASFAAPTSTSGPARDLATSTDGTRYYAITGTTISRLNAATGAYDTTFDGDGQLTIAQEANYVQFTPTVVQPLADGSILVAGQYGSVNLGIKRASFRHYNANGSLDATFGTLGAPSPLSNNSLPGRLILQPDGKVVAAVNDVSTGSGTQGYAMRINAPLAGAAGTFDAGFGSGFLFTPNFSTSYAEAIGDLDLDASGRLTGSALGYQSTSTTGETALFRLTASGTLDTTFGGALNGYKRHVYDGGASEMEWGPRELVIDPSNARLYTVTSIRGIASVTQDQFLERFTLAGDVDTTFGTSGTVRTSYDIPQSERITNARTLPDDSVLFVGSVSPNAGSALVAKLNPDGTPAAFGTGGVAAVDFGSRSSYLFDVAPSPGGKLVAVGRASFYTTNWVDDFALARFNADGRLDTTFGSAGKVVTGFPGGDVEQFYKVFVAPDGTVYAAGAYQTLGTSGVRTGAIIRYAPTGQLDTSFGTGGILKLDTLFADGPQVTFTHVEVVGGNLLIAGTHETGLYQYDSFIARLGPDGAPDPTFGTGGVARYHSGADGDPGMVRFVADPVGGHYLTLDLAEDVGYVDRAYVRRYTLDGQLDTAWAIGGMATVTTQDAINDLDVLPDGRLRLTGTRSVLGSPTNTRDLVFIGLTSDGAVDTDFGIDGFQTMDFAKSDNTTALLPVAGGRFVLAGTFDPTGTNNDFFATRLNGGADVVPPRIASTTADYETRRAIVVQFSESVLATLAKTDLSVRRYDYFGATPLNPANYTFDAVDVGGATRLTITLAASVPDGNFDLYIPAGAIADAPGNATTAGLFSTKVFFLAGDANRDRVVNFNDLLILARNYNGTGKTFAGGDFNYDGTVNFSDLLILARGYNATMPTPAAAASPVTAAAVTSSGVLETEDGTAPVISSAAIAKPLPGKPKAALRPGKR